MSFVSTSCPTEQSYSPIVRCNLEGISAAVVVAGTFSFPASFACTFAVEQPDRFRDRHFIRYLLSSNDAGQNVARVIEKPPIGES